MKSLELDRFVDRLLVAALAEKRRDGGAIEFGRLCEQACPGHPEAWNALARARILRDGLGYFDTDSRFPWTRTFRLSAAGEHRATCLAKKRSATARARRFGAAFHAILIALAAAVAAALGLALA